MEVQQQACKENLRDRPKVAFHPCFGLLALYQNCKGFS